MSAILEPVLDAERRAACQRNDAVLLLQDMADQIRARHAAKLPARPVCVSVAPAPLPSVDEYRAALARQDWSFERSDDHGAWCAGRDSLAALRRMQILVDPTFSIWNEYAGVAA